MVYNKSHYYHEYSFMNWATWVMLTVEDSQIARICLLLTTSTVINSWKILIQDVVVLLFIKWTVRVVLIVEDFQTFQICFLLVTLTVMKP